MILFHYEMNVKNEYKWIVFFYFEGILILKILNDWEMMFLKNFRMLFRWKLCNNNGHLCTG